MSRDQLLNQIIDFMIVIRECYLNTTYINDRSVYASDLAVTVGWVARIRAGENLDAIRSMILDHSTQKHFSDYWRQGPWGENEVSAFNDLIKNLTI